VTHDADDGASETKFFLLLLFLKPLLFTFFLQFSNPFQLRFGNISAKNVIFRCILLGILGFLASRWLWGGFLDLLGLSLGLSDVLILTTFVYDFGVFSG
jgi:hypothetical protein